MTQLTLISHALCPYVQRATIALTEKGVPFDRVTIDLAAKPDWFLALSPLGKVPVLIVRDGDRETALFESAAIVEYLEDTQPPPLHPADAVTRARHRAWIEVASTTLAAIARLYGATDEAAFAAEQGTLGGLLDRVEAELAGRVDGPWFAGPAFSLVDAAFAPVFRYLDTFEQEADLWLAEGRPALAPWRAALARRASVRSAVDADYPARLAAFLMARGGVLGRRLGRRRLRPTG